MWKRVKLLALNIKSNGRLPVFSWKLLDNRCSCTERAFFESRGRRSFLFHYLSKRHKKLMSIPAQWDKISTYRAGQKICSVYFRYICFRIRWYEWTLLVIDCRDSIIGLIRIGVKIIWDITSFEKYKRKWFALGMKRCAYII